MKKQYVMAKEKYFQSVMAGLIRHLFVTSINSNCYLLFYKVAHRLRQGSPKESFGRTDVRALVMLSFPRQAQDKLSKHMLGHHRIYKSQLRLITIFQLVFVCKEFIKRWRIKPAMTFNRIVTLYILLITSSATAQNVGINTSGPDRRLDILDAANPQLRLSHTDATHYSDFQTTSSGYLYINPSGSRLGIGTLTAPNSLFHLYGGTANSAEEKAGQLFDGATSGTGDGLYMDLFDKGSFGSRISAANTYEFYIGAYGGATRYFSVINGNASGTNLGNVGIGVSAPTSKLHTVASGAKTTDYTGNLFTNIATSSTASVTKVGLDIQSTGTWDGASAVNIAVKTTATGGTTVFDAWFPTGRVACGSGALTAAGAGDHLFLKEYNAANQATAGLQGSYTQTSTNSNYCVGVLGQALSIANGASNTAWLRGVQGFAQSLTSGTTTSAISLQVYYLSAGAGTTVTNMYGLYVEDMSASTATNAYSIYSAGGPIYIAGGICSGSPTGGYLGAGTINSTAVYDDNVLLTDFVFDNYYDGKILEEDKVLHSTYKMKTLDEMIAFTKEKKHLPTIMGRAEWNKTGKPSIGKLSSQLWETLETQAIYIKELKEMIDQQQQTIAFQQEQINRKLKEQKEILAKKKRK